MALNSFDDLFVEDLRDLYSAEKQLVKALPKMAEAASTAELKNAFTMHLDQTKGHVARLERIFERMNQKPTGKTCKAMEGLIAEGEEIISMRGDAKVKDAALIGAAQKVEHYEIAGYGTARTYAQELGMDDAVDILQQTLDEESNTNEMLTQIATGRGAKVAVNEEAMKR
jgi:ferritin-like metal-binding protein YciE